LFLASADRPICATTAAFIAGAGNLLKGTAGFSNSPGVFVGPGTRTVTLMPVPRIS
jgi:hypothetical protein